MVLSLIEKNHMALFMLYQHLVQNQMTPTLAAYPHAAYPHAAYPHAAYPHAAYPHAAYPHAAYPHAAYQHAAYQHAGLEEFHHIISPVSASSGVARGILAVSTEATNSALCTPGSASVMSNGGVEQHTVSKMLSFEQEYVEEKLAHLYMVTCTSPITLLLLCLHCVLSGCVPFVDTVLCLPGTSIVIVCLLILLLVLCHIACMSPVIFCCCWH